MTLLYPLPDCRLDCIARAGPVALTVLARARHAHSDNLRKGLCHDLGFGKADRAENVRHVDEVARLMAEVGLIVIVALVSPVQADRA